MKTLIVLASVGLTLALPQWGGHGIGGGLGKGGEFGPTIVGLSRGIEIHHGGGGGGGEGGGEGGGGGGGGGGHHHSIGWGGSHFNTPVDVHHEEAVHLKAHPEYHYEYKVADHKHKDYHQQHEVRDGYKVKGSYSLLEPDHKRVRVVDYTSDKKQGFIAKVYWKHHD